MSELLEKRSSNKVRAARSSKESALRSDRGKGARPRVSIIIPSYNHEQFVARAVESVLAQTYQDFEIIITDDASTDGSVDVLSAYARADPRITLFLNRFNYERHATNHCIQHASGEYIAVLSSDDEFFPTKLEKQVDFLDHHPKCAAVFTQARIIDDEGRDFPDSSHGYYTIFQQPNRSRHEWLRHFFFSGNCLCHPSVLIRRSVYDTLGVYNPLMGALDDLDMWTRVCLHCEIHILPDTLVNFRVRANQANVSADTPENFRRGQYETIKILDHFQSSQGLTQLHLIFPELANEGHFAADAVKRHGLAMMALKAGGLPHRFWAIDILYQLLSDPEAKSQLHHRISTAPELDFVRLNGALNPFAVEHRPSAQVFWAETGAFSEVNSRSRYCCPSQWSELRFPVPAWDPAMPLRFDPCDCIGVVRIAGMKVVSQADGRCLWNWNCVLDSPEVKVTLTGTAAWLSSDRHAISILSTGNDPQLHVFGIPPMPDLPLELHVWMKLEARLDRVAEEIECLNHAMMDRNATAQSLKNSITESEATLVRLSAENEVLKAAATKSEATLVRLSAENEVLKAAATESEATLVRLSAENDSLKAISTERHDVVNTVLSSRSWRYTRPLRSVWRLFGSGGPAKNPER